MKLVLTLSSWLRVYDPTFVVSTLLMAVYMKQPSQSPQWICPGWNLRTKGDKDFFPARR